MYYQSLTLLKWVFFLGAFSVVGGIFFYSTFEDMKEEFDRPEGLGHAPHEVFGLQLFLRDKTQGQLRLEAAYAYSLDEDPRSFELIKPRGTLSTEKAETSEIAADRGRYDGSSSRATLTGHVHFHNSAGYKLMTNTAYIDTVSGRVWGTGRVWGAGPFGTIEAGRFEILESGKKVKLYKQSRIELNDPKS